MTRRMLGCLVALALPLYAVGCSSAPSETAPTVQQQGLGMNDHDRDRDRDHHDDKGDKDKDKGDRDRDHDCKKHDDDDHHNNTMVIDRLTVVSLDTGSLVLAGNITATGVPVSFPFDAVNAVLNLANFSSPWIPGDPCIPQATNYNNNVIAGEVSADGGRFAPVADYAAIIPSCKATITVTAGLIEAFQPVP